MKIEVPEGYEITPRENYSYDRFGEWWPSKWKGGAWVCPKNHQMPKEKFDHGFHGGNEYGTFCPGCNRWVDRKLMKWDPTEKKCTMGYARRKSEFEEETEDADNSKTVPASVEVPACGEDRERRSPGTAPRDTVDSRKTRRRKSKRIVGSGSE